MTSEVELAVLRIVSEANDANVRPTKDAIGLRCGSDISASKAYSTTNALLERGWLKNESGGGPYKIAITEDGKRGLRLKGGTNG